MPNVKKVILMGILGRDPETRNLTNGGSITNFSIETSEKWKDKAPGLVFFYINNGFI
ncbi:single-stranded DNA-binding protein [Acinetobacter sp. 251-1]|nr:single-stranded DNA-binding protein [Acinetobacter sp. 251-1]MDM1762177.1 single-stranded DNA-binding protein [Acinetobacter sp. 251-1]